jgi:hypothetical protein
MCVCARRVTACACACVHACAWGRVRVCAWVCLRARACVQTENTYVRVCSLEIDIDTYGDLCVCYVCVACFSVLVRARCAAPAATPEFNPPGFFALGASPFDPTKAASILTCPAGMVPMPIGSDLCERAAKAAGRPYGGNVATHSMPAGCVWYSAGGSFYFNTAPSDVEHAIAQPVCAGAPCFCTAAAISRAQICVWVCVCVCACMCVCVCVCVRVT